MTSFMIRSRIPPTRMIQTGPDWIQIIVRTGHLPDRSRSSFIVHRKRRNKQRCLSSLLASTANFKVDAVMMSSFFAAMDATAPHTASSTTPPLHLLKGTQWTADDAPVFVTAERPHLLHGVGRGEVIAERAAGRGAGSSVRRRRFRGAVLLFGVESVMGSQYRGGCVVVVLCGGGGGTREGDGGASTKNVLIG